MQHNRKKVSIHFFAFLAIMLIILASCPIKQSIKKLVGSPANQEQSLGHKINLFGGVTTETCSLHKISNIEAATVNPVQTKDGLFLTFFTIFASLFFISGKDKNSFFKSFGIIKSPHLIPAFIKYRKILI